MRVRARLAADLRERLLLADEDRELGEALDRWELSLFSEEPFRSAQVREALACLLGADGGIWAASLRAAVLLAEKGAERGEVLAGLRAEQLDRVARDSVRRVLVEALLHGSRSRAGRRRRRDADRPAAAAVERLARRLSDVFLFTEPAQTRHTFARSVRAWMTQRGCWSG